MLHFLQARVKAKGRESVSCMRCGWSQSPTLIQAIPGFGRINTRRKRKHEAKIKGKRKQQLLHVTPFLYTFSSPVSNHETNDARGRKASVFHQLSLHLSPIGLRMQICFLHKFFEFASHLFFTRVPDTFSFKTRTCCAIDVLKAINKPSFRMSQNRIKCPTFFNE